jgi:hypothetical protein
VAGLIISFAIPDDILPIFGVPLEQLDARVRLLVAAKLYEMKRASVGTAATIAGLDMAVFLEQFLALQASVDGAVH